MTGTSLDGLDLSLVRIEGHGLEMRAQPIAHDAAGLGPLARRLRTAAEGAPLPAGAFAELALELGRLVAAAAAAFCERTRVRPTLAAVHGQTIYHRPPLSWQIVNPHPIAAALACPVVFDLRGADLCEGGQGAPLTPLGDWVLFRAAHARAVINLGGFANATLLAPSTAPLADTRGRDLCACNQLLDRAARELLAQPFDRDGTTALSGRCHEPAAQAMAAHLNAMGDGRSLGTGDEAWPLVDALRPRMDPADVLATLSEAIGLAIGTTLREARVADAVLAGGGARHRRLRDSIARAAGCRVLDSTELGVALEEREALEWAILGALAEDRVPVTLPAVTHRKASLLCDGLWCHPRTSSSVHL